MKKLILIGTFTIVAYLTSTVPALAQCSSNITVLGNGPGSMDALWGEMISGIGDLDDDGLPDIIIARDSYFSTAGGVFAYSGLTGDSIRQIFDGTKVFSMSVFGDFDHDGYDDVLVNGQIYSGADGSMLADYYDVARDGVAIGGDLNGDGRHDIIVGNPSWASGTKLNVGRVDVLSGLTGDTIRSWPGFTDGYRFGEVIAPAGYFNNDNIPDILVGMPRSDLYGTNRGRIFVLSGAASMDTLFQRGGSGDYTEFGQMVAPLGNINGDGYDDIAAVEEVNGKMVIRVWSGGLAADQHLLYSLDEPDNAGLWPSSFSNAGDIDGDGRNDVIVGDYRYSNGKGRIQIYSGFYAGVELYSHYYRYEDGMAHGYTVAGIGDVDGDGDFEIAAAAPTLEDSVGNMLGGVFIYHCFYPSEECQADDDPDEDGLGNLCDNCDYGANPSQEDANRNGLGDACEDSRNLYVYNGVYSSLTAGGQTVSFHFDTVSIAGILEMTVTETGPEAGANFELVPNDPPKYFNISTEATYSGAITITINYDTTGMSTEDEAKVSLYHHDGSDWVDITIERQPDLNRVIGETASLSPFVIGRVSTCCGLYTNSFTGNTDCDLEGKRNIADVTRLIDRVYLSKTVLCCEENGNTDGDIDAKMNISDITTLIDNIYLSKQETAACN